MPLQTNDDGFSPKDLFCHWNHRKLIALGMLVTEVLLIGIVLYCKLNFGSSEALMSQIDKAIRTWRALLT